MVPTLCFPKPQSNPWQCFFSTTETVNFTQDYSLPFSHVNAIMF